MTATPCSSAELARLVQKVEPAALLVPSRILRRVIKTHRGLGGLGLRVPHPHSYWIDRDSLLKIATPGELSHSETNLPERVLLLPRLDESVLRRKPPGEVLRDTWRYLFHAHVHLALAQRRKALDSAAMRSRIERLGTIVFAEARAVLEQDNAVFDPRDDAEVYEEFAAVYLELKHFDPARLHAFFPAVLDHDAVEAVFADDVDAAAILHRTRLPGAAASVSQEPEAEEITVEQDGPESGQPGELRVRADAVAKRGNLVRAALLRYKAIRSSPATQAGALRGQARAEIDQLAHRLEAALHFPERYRADWSRCLRALLEPAARGVWPVEARLLYDLQKICVDHERPIFAVDLVEWFVSWFQRPIQRHLPDQPVVLAVKHLRTAIARLAKSRLPDSERHRLRELLQESLTKAELELRRRFQPRLVTALDKVGLVPGNVAERLSRDRLVEELLDLVVARTYLTMGDLRDAVARSRVKLPDLLNPIEFFTGDPLIRLNRQLAGDLDGVYRRGEIYLRWLQRLSSLFFGNPVGRAITLYLLLPFLGAFFIMAFINVLFEEVHHFLHVPRLHTSDLAPLFRMDPSHAMFAPFNALSYGVLAVFLVPMLHWAGFRQMVFQGLYNLWWAIRGLLYDLPAGVFRLRLVRAILQSRPYLLFWNYLAKPALLTLPVGLCLWWFGAPAASLYGISAGALVLFSVLMNTRLGLLVQESITDAAMRSWQMVREDWLPGLFQAVVWFFRALLERVDKVIYTVDEWLRFREGDGRGAFYTKMILGLLWFLITYVVRFAITLLIEPQINPIKHFPVVTVSHKLSLLAVAPVSNLTGIPGAYVFTVLSLVPGVFGFLAWELKENWKLYRANGSPTVDPEMVGSHGEQVIHLMRPGFHSGTLPKLYAKMRRASGAKFRKSEEGLHHVEEGVHHFLERELVAVLAAARNWNVSASVAVSHVWLATNRVRVELSCPALTGESVLLDFEHRAGFLLAGVARPGWLATLDTAQRSAFRDALVGLYKKAGVDLVHEDLRKLFGELMYEVTDAGLFVGPDTAAKAGMVYDLSRPDDPPRAVNGGEVSGPARARALLLSERPLAWQAWVEVWEQEQPGKPHDPPALAGVELLPA